MTFRLPAVSEPEADEILWIFHSLDVQRASASLTPESPNTASCLCYILFTYVGCVCPFLDVDWLADGRSSDAGVSSVGRALVFSVWIENMNEPVNFIGSVIMSCHYGSTTSITNFRGRYLTLVWVHQMNALVVQKWYDQGGLSSEAKTPSNPSKIVINFFFSSSLCFFSASFSYKIFSMLSQLPAIGQKVFSHCKWIKPWINFFHPLSITACWSVLFILCVYLILRHLRALLLLDKTLFLTIFNWLCKSHNFLAAAPGAVFRRRS